MKPFLTAIIVLGAVTFLILVIPMLIMSINH